jgi:hypothetical protein
MSSDYVFFCAQSAASDLGVDWSMLFGILLGVAALMIVIRGVGVVAARRITTPASTKSTKSRTQPLPIPPGTKDADAGVTPELVAVLTAAATVALGRPVRIGAISVGKMAAQRCWSQEGRREIYLSHRIR